MAERAEPVTTTIMFDFNQTPIMERFSGQEIHFFGIFCDSLLARGRSNTNGVIFTYFWFERQITIETQKWNS